MRISLRRLRRDLRRWEFLEDRRLLSAAPATPLTVPPPAADYAPALHGPSTLSVVQGGTVALNGANLITDSDIDAGTTVETVSLSVTGGTLTLGFNNGSLIAGANNSSQMTISGTLTQLNDTLATLSYKAPVSGSSFTLTAVANDGVLNSVPLATSITVTPDQAPVINGPVGVNVTQGATLPLVGADLLSITDVDAGTRVETLSLSANGGTLSYTASGTTLLGGANGSSTLTISGTLAELNAALATLRYTAPAIGQIYDLLATVNDGVLNSQALTVPIFILSDQAPALTGPAALSVTQGMTVPLDGANLISVAHVSTGMNPESVTVSVTGGTLSYSTSYGTLVAGANGSGELTFSGTLAQVNQSLASLIYKAPLAGPPITLTAVANDGVLDSVPLTTIITPLADTAPVVTGPNFLAAYQGMATPLDGPDLITLSSPNGAPNLESLSLSVTGGTLSVNTLYATVLNGSNNSAALTLSGTVPQLNETLATLSYKAPLTLTNYALTVVASDGVLDSLPLTTEITVGRDAGPSVSGPAVVNITQGATVSLNGANLISVADPDMGTGVGSVSLSVNAGALSYATNFATLIAGANGSSQLTLSGTLAQLNAALATLSYKAPAAGTGPLYSLVAVANDGAVSSVPLTTEINLGADQAPTVSGPASLSVSQGEMIPLVGPNLISLAHGGTAPSVETVTLSVTGGTLSYASNFGTLTGGANDSGLITLSGTLAELNETLATLSYKAPPSGTQFILTAVANDGVLNSATLTVPINIPDPWQNPVDHLDVLDNGIISPADALVIINYLNTHSNGVLPPISQPPEYYLDVDGTGVVTPLDALAIIDYLDGDPINLATPAVSTAAAAASSNPVPVGGASQAGAGAGAVSVSPAAVAPSTSNAAVAVRQEGTNTGSSTIPANTAQVAVDAALADLGPVWKPVSDPQS